MIAVSFINEDSPLLTSDMILVANEILSTNANTNLLQGLSVLQLCLVRFF